MQKIVASKKGVEIVDMTLEEQEALKTIETPLTQEQIDKKKEIEKAKKELEKSIPTTSIGLSARVAALELLLQDIIMEKMNG